MSIDEMRGRLVEVRDEVEQLLAEDTLTDEQEARYTELTDEFETLNTTIATQEARAAKLDEIRAAADRGPTAVEDGTRKAPYVNAGLSRTDPYNTDDLRLNTPASELRARAESAVEKTVGDLGDAERQSAIEVLRGIKDPGGVLARRILATGTPAFRSAFQKRSTGYADLMDADERQAVVRAQSLTGGEGGFAIPFTLDPTII